MVSNFCLSNDKNSTHNFEFSSTHQINSDDISPNRFNSVKSYENKTSSLSFKPCCSIFLNQYKKNISSESLKNLSLRIANSNEFSFFLPEKESVSEAFNPKRCTKETQTSFSSKGSSYNTNLRWLICFCDSLINISKFYCMDSAQALQTYFFRGELMLSSTEYNLFYSISAIFFIVTFFSGYFIEKNGVRLSFFLFNLLIFIGHLFFTIGASFENYKLMLFGRFLFGIGSYCIEVCQDLIITEWFFDRELAFALGMSFASCRFGSALTILFTPKIMIDGGYFYALLLGLVLNFIGVVCSIIIVIIDRNFEEEKGDKELLESFLGDFSFIDNELTLEKIKGIGWIFWMLVLNAFFAYACYFGFVNNSNDILCTLYGYTPQEAGELVTIMYFSAALTPLFGFVIDRIGKRVNIVLFSIGFLIIPFINFVLLPVYISEKLIEISLLLIGVFFSCYAAVLWSCFPLIIEGKKKFMAFAIIYTTLNIALILASGFVGISVDFLGGNEKGNKKYHCAFFCMIFCLIISFLLVLRISMYENKKIVALNSFEANQEIRNIMNEDPNLGQKLLEMIIECEQKNIEMKVI